jgi:hypothetical protein
MQNLQDLYDFYIDTKPSPGKIKAASSLLIRLCKVLNLSSPEKITNDYYKEIPKMIDQYHGSSRNQAAQDKSVLAEMIGRYSPKDGWEATFDILLDDKDENLRQFTLHTLEFSENENPEISLNYIEKYKDNPETTMRHVAAHLAAALLTGKHFELMKKKLELWCDNNHQHFAKDVLKGIRNCDDMKPKSPNRRSCEKAREWLTSRFNL